MSGKLKCIQNEGIKEKLRSDLNKQELFDLMSDFREGIKEGNYAEKGWPKWILAVAKVGINHYAKVLSQY